MPSPVPYDENDDGTNSFVILNQDSNEPDRFSPDDKELVDKHEEQLISQIPSNPFSEGAYTSDDNLKGQNPFSDELSNKECVESEIANLETQREFDPASDWGQPMELPAPAPPPSEGATNDEPAKKSASKTKPGISLFFVFVACHFLSICVHQFNHFFSKTFRNFNTN